MIEVKSIEYFPAQRRVHWTGIFLMTGGEHMETPLHPRSQSVGPIAFAVEPLAYAHPSDAEIEEARAAGAPLPGRRPIVHDPEAVKILRAAVDATPEGGTVAPDAIRAAVQASAQRVELELTARRLSPAVVHSLSIEP